MIRDYLHLITALPRIQSDPDVGHVLAGVGIAVCVGVVVVVWVAGALYNALHTLHNAPACSE